MLVKRLPVIDFEKELRNIKKREDYYSDQYLAQDILAFMEKQVPKDAYCVMGLRFMIFTLVIAGFLYTAGLSTKLELESSPFLGLMMISGGKRKRKWIGF